MTGKINDGGPAFPQIDNTGQNGEGMSLRDWFAGCAIRPLLRDIGASTTSSENREERPGQTLSLLAYHLADEMIAARAPEPRHSLDNNQDQGGLEIHAVGYDLEPSDIPDGYCVVLTGSKIDVQAAADLFGQSVFLKANAPDQAGQTELAAAALMRRAHAAMRRCGWHLAPAAGGQGDGSLEYELAEIEEKIGAIVFSSNEGEAQ